MDYTKRRVLIAVAAFAIVAFHAPQSHGAGSAPVTVVNTPLPVTGNITVQGSTSVSGNVEITGKVKIDDSTPLRVLETSSRQPFAHNIVLFNASTNYAVPSGKRAVIETITLSANQSEASDHTNFMGFSLQVTTNAVSVKHRLAPLSRTFSQIQSNDVREYAGTWQTKLYADGGSTVSVDLYLAGPLEPSLFGTNYVTLSGYLEDVP